MDAIIRRKNRAYQAAHRGSGRSYKTELENAQLFLAWEAGDLSEGQVASALNLDRLTARIMRDAARETGVAICEQLKRKQRPD